MQDIKIALILALSVYALYRFLSIYYCSMNVHIRKVKRLDAMESKIANDLSLTESERIKAIFKLWNNYEKGYLVAQSKLAIYLNKTHHLNKSDHSPTMDEVVYHPTNTRVSVPTLRVGDKINL